MIQAQSSSPLYLQVEALLKEKINNKEYLPGDKIPSEEELCEQYQVSRITIRKAIQELADQNVLEKRRGKGTFVSHQVQKINIGHPNGFSTYITTSGHSSRHLILTKDTLPADDFLASRLQLNTGDPVCYVKRIFYEDDIPFGIDEIYISSVQYPGFLDQMTNSTSFYHILDTVYHVNRGESITELYAHIITSEQATLLQSRVGGPSFQVNKLCYDTDGHPVHFSRSIVCGEKVCYSIRSNATLLSLTSEMVGKE